MIVIHVTLYAGKQTKHACHGGRDMESPCMRERMYVLCHGSIRRVSRKFDACMFVREGAVFECECE